MRIGELAKRTEVSVRSLRYYEEQQLLASTRTHGGQREYADDAVDRVRLIQLLYAAGLNSRDVVQLLPCVYSGTTSPSMVAMLHAERARINDQAQRLAATLARLDDVIAEARDRLRVSA